MARSRSPAIKKVVQVRKGGSSPVRSPSPPSKDKVQSPKRPMSPPLRRPASPPRTKVTKKSPAPVFEKKNKEEVKVKSEEQPKAKPAAASKGKIEMISMIRPKKPMTAYMCFVKKNFGVLKAKNPEGGLIDIIRLCAADWKKISKRE